MKAEFIIRFMIRTITLCVSEIPLLNTAIALAQFGGHAMIEFADMDILPFRFSDFTNVIAQYIKEVSKLADDMREETETEK